MAIKELTQEQIDFINENRFSMTLTKMGEATGIGYTRLHHYMVKNNLLLTKEEKAARYKISPKKKSHKGEWVAEPWDYKLNLITMHPC